MVMPGEAVRCARNRAGTYLWLARWFLAPPDRTMVETLRSGPASILLGEKSVGLALGSVEAVEALVERLAILWERLFSAPGPEHVPALESAFRTDLPPAFMAAAEQDHTVELASFKRQFPQIATLPPDHLGVELALMSAFYLKEVDAILAEDRLEAEALAEQRLHFHRKHLAQWVNPFAEQLQAVSPNCFYARLAFLVRDFIRSEI